MGLVMAGGVMTGFHGSHGEVLRDSGIDPPLRTGQLLP